MRVKPQNRRQHEHRCNHGVHKKLHRRIHLALVAEHANQQRHRNQRCFPEEIKEEQIKRHEHANQRRFQNQQQDEEFLHPLVNRLPRNQHAQGSEKRSQHHQPHRDAVHAHVVVDVGSGDPLLVDLELKAASARDGNRPADAEKATNVISEITSAKTRMSRSRRGSSSSSNAARQRHERHQRKNERAETVRVHRPIPIQTM